MMITVSLVNIHTWWLRWERVHLQRRGPKFDPWVRNIPCWRKWQPTPVLLLGEVYGQKSLVGHRVRHD